MSVGLKLLQRSHLGWVWQACSTLTASACTAYSYEMRPFGRKTRFVVAASIAASVLAVGFTPAFAECQVRASADRSGPVAKHCCCGDGCKCGPSCSEGKAETPRDEGLPSKPSDRQGVLVSCVLSGAGISAPLMAADSVRPHRAESSEAPAVRTLILQHTCLQV